MKTIRHQMKPNPYSRYAAPMRLYFVAELELAAMTKLKVANRKELYVLLNQRREKQATRTEQIRRNKQLTKEQRKNELEQELLKNGLSLRSDSEVADWYINNSKRAHTLLQSVTLIRRAHIVRQHGGQYYGELVDNAYASLNANIGPFDEVDETWADDWRDEKLAAEETVHEFWTKVKQSGSLKAIRNCACGEPLFDPNEVEAFREKLEKKEKKLRNKK